MPEIKTDKTQFSLLSFCYSKNSTAMSESPTSFFRAGGVDNSLSALFNTSLNPASSLFEIYFII